MFAAKIIYHAKWRLFIWIRSRLGSSFLDSGQVELWSTIYFYKLLLQISTMHTMPMVARLYWFNTAEKWGKQLIIGLAKWSINNGSANNFLISEKSKKIHLLACNTLFWLKWPLHCYFLLWKWLRWLILKRYTGYLHFISFIC